jgi:predicted dehydrogenase
MDVGIYALQTTRYISGREPIQVTATETKTDPVKFKEVDETVTWDMKFPDGVTAHCGTTFNAMGMNDFTVQAQNGSFGLDPAYNYNGLAGKRSDGVEINPTETDQFAVEMDNFAQCILNKTPTKVSGEEGMRDVRILMAIYDSIKTGKPVDLA